MIIRNIHIENFGKLHNFNMSLHEGLNSICEANGFGKTTLSAFITVMFYGFDGERKQKDTENERHRYAPWQGGAYGGSLTFEQGGKTYLLERGFGEKNGKNDTFDIYELPSRLPSQDYHENIGEEIFRIDRDSFARTALISQLQMKTTPTSEITAQMGGLAGEIADLGNFETVDRTIKDKLNKLSPSRSTGEIYKLNAAVKQNEQKILEGNHLQEAIAERSQLIAQLSQQRDEKSAEFEELQEETDYIIRKRDDLNSVRPSDEELEKRKKLLNRFSFLRDSGQINAGNFTQKLADTKAALKELQNLEQDQESLTNAIYALKADEAKQKTELQTLEYEIQTQKQIIEDAEMAEEEIAGRASGKASGKANGSVSEDEESEQNSAHSGTINALRVPGLLLIALGIAGFIMKLPVIILVIAATLGLIMFIASFIVSARDSRSYRDDRDDREAERSAEHAAEIKAANILLTKYEKEYNNLVKESDKLKKKLDEAEQEHSRIRTQAQQLSQSIDEFCRETRINADGVQVGEELTLLESAWNEIPQLERKYRTFRSEEKACRGEEENLGLPGVITSSPAFTEFLEERRSQLAQIRTQVEDITAKHYENENILKGLMDEVDLLQAVEEELDEQRDRLAKLVQGYSTLQKTQKYLTEARSKMLLRYIGPYKDAFEKYYKMIEPELEKEYVFDANLEISVNELGRNRNLELMSTGYRDLVNLSSRMAMLDTMYEHEKPVLIMDDPFVNLDRAKFTHALNFLKQAAEEYQIIYFSCR